MGINPNDRRYNCHHIVGREEYRRNREYFDEQAKNTPLHRFSVDGVGNLFPLRLEDHQFIHEVQGDFIQPRRKRKHR